MSEEAKEAEETKEVLTRSLGNPSYCIKTVQGLKYQVWRDDEPVSCIYQKQSMAIKFMQRLIRDNGGNDIST